MKIAKKTMMEIQMSVADTDGETPLAVFMSPWTIQGWRPFSVSIQPAVIIKNGAITAHGAIRRNHLARSRRCRYTFHPPHNAQSMMSVARYAMTRIDQYWMKTLGT